MGFKNILGCTMAQSDNIPLQLSCFLTLLRTIKRKVWNQYYQPTQEYQKSSYYKLVKVANHVLLATLKLYVACRSLFKILFITGKVFGVDAPSFLQNVYGGDLYPLSGGQGSIAIFWHCRSYLQRKNPTSDLLWNMVNCVLLRD